MQGDDFDIVYGCFFCGEGIEADDPERTDLLLIALEAQTGPMYACHLRCARVAAHDLIEFVDPKTFE
jgi:hypothetical protein